MLYSHENWVLGSIFINMEGICVIEQCMVWSYCNKYMDIYVLRQSNNDYLWMMKLYDFYFFIILFSMLDFSCIATLADWAAKTKCYRLGGLNSRHLFLTVWSLRSPRSRCQSIWFSVRALFLLCRCLPSYCVLTWRRGGSERMNCSLSSYKGTKLIGGLILVTSFKPNFPPKAPPPNTITLWVRASAYKF